MKADGLNLRPHGAFVRGRGMVQKSGLWGCGQSRHQVLCSVLTVPNYIEEFHSHFCCILITYSQVPSFVTPLLPGSLEGSESSAG